MTPQELENWFANVEHPEAPLYLDPATKINDVKVFLDSHLYPLKLDPDNKINDPIMKRLLRFKLLIESNL